MKTMLTLPAMLWLATVVVAAPPDLTLTRTEVKVPGDILRITAKADGIKSYKWRVWTEIGDAGPSKEQIDSLTAQVEAIGGKVTFEADQEDTVYYLTCDCGSSIDLPTWAGQRWIVFACVSNETGELSDAMLDIQCPGGKPDPVPPPPVPPPVPDVHEPPAGVYGVSIPFFRAAMKAPAGDRKVVALIVSAALGSAAAQADGQSMINSFEQQLATSLTADQKAEWAAFKDEYISQLTRLKPTLGTDASKWRAVFSEAAVGVGYVIAN